MCLVDGSRSIQVPIIHSDQVLVHFNSLWCHLFHVLSLTKGMSFFQICPSKNMHISSLLDRVFPAIPSTKNEKTPFISTKTVAYIFGLVIDSVTLHHTDSPHSRALEHEATMLQELDSMTPDAFRAELRTALISFYEGILKVPGAGGRPVAKNIKRRFAGKHADAPAPAPAPTDGAPTDGAPADGAPADGAPADGAAADGAAAGVDSRAETPAPEAAPAASGRGQGRKAVPKASGAKG
jgi:hypothetical protein